MKFNIYIIIGGENVLKKIVKFISSIMGIAVGYIIGKVLITLGIKQIRQQAMETTLRTKTVEPLHTTLWMIQP